MSKVLFRKEKRHRHCKHEYSRDIVAPLNICRLMLKQCRPEIYRIVMQYHKTGKKPYYIHIIYEIFP